MPIIRKTIAAMTGGLALLFIGAGLMGILLLSWGACTPEGNPLVQIPATLLWVVMVFLAVAALITAVIKLWPEEEAEES